jgi:hypothetical protein
LVRRERELLDAQYKLTTWRELYLNGEIDADLRRPVPGVWSPYAVRPGWYAESEMKSDVLLHISGLISANENK